MKQRCLTIFVLISIIGINVYSVTRESEDAQVISMLRFKTLNHSVISLNHTEPTATPTAEPTAVPTAEPTAVSTAKPTAVPTAKPIVITQDNKTGHPEWWDSPYWETPFINWNETNLYTHPTTKEIPSYIRLTTAMLRTVSDNKAIFWGRNPDGGMRVHISSDEVPPLTLIEGPHQWNTSTGVWSTRGSFDLMTNETDYTSTIVFTDLPADTPFKYVIQLYINGTWFNHFFGNLQTFPEVGSLSNQSLVFAFGSCINPHHKKSSTGASLRLLATYAPALRFFLFIGDFIYFWDELEHTRKEYLPYYYRKLATREVVNAMRSYPWFFQFDDHEVHNDYSSGPKPDPNSTVHKEFLYSWDNMIAKANPANPPDVIARIPPEDLQFVRWYQYSHGNSHFFVADVRSYKVNKGDLTGQLLGATQFAALETWVKTKCLRKTHSWCFFVSPTVFSHGSYREDLWYGNMREQKEVVKLFSENPDSCPISILSGDSHIAAAWEVAETVHEFTCSPVDAFGILYPWKKPPSRHKKRRRWPELGDLPPPKTFFEHKPRHLGPAGFNCLVEVTTTIGANSVQVTARFDMIDGFNAKLLASHIQNYTHNV